MLPFLWGCAGVSTALFLSTMRIVLFRLCCAPDTKQ